MLTSLKGEAVGITGSIGLKYVVQYWSSIWVFAFPDKIDNQLFIWLVDKLMHKTSIPSMIMMLDVLMMRFIRVGY